MDLVRNIQKYWQVYALLVGVILTYAAVIAREDALERRIADIEAAAQDMRVEIKQTQTAQNEIKVHLSQIQTDLSWIRAKLEKL